ncbi:hypothetical protein [Zwartia sp.]|uniref:hypothetical protein n=1 Tax=Zwartia sp. TaxID=2978004 RepID=UPI00271DDA92|nr:hypothetical protein [Zwartia sp.]MDO9024011.1 hypothetical protein [Zwartia sp.]
MRDISSVLDKRRRLVLGVPLALTALMTGCAGVVPPDAFTVSEELLGMRQLQSRRFNGITEKDALIASSNVLQDMGYNLENSEVSLGVLTANKQRDATNAGEIVGAVVFALLFGVAAPVSKSQSIRVSLVIQPAGSESAIAQTYAGATGTTPIEAAGKALGRLPATQQQPVLDAALKPGNYVVRLTFQRVVTRTDNSVYVETIKDPDIYQEFFEKLSKSVFIEAQQV